MQKTLLIALALSSIFLQAYGVIPTGYQIDYCSDCPYTNCCDFNLSCAASFSQCQYSGNRSVARPTSQCYNTSCPYSCCINGVCGTLNQCTDRCYSSSSCKSGCCASYNICGNKAYCSSVNLGYTIPAIIGLVIAVLLVLVGFIVCCKSCNLSSKYTKKTPPIGTNTTVYTGSAGQQNTQPLIQNQQNVNNFGYQPSYQQQQYTQPQQQQYIQPNQQVNYPQMQGYNPNAYTQAPNQYGH